jgi:hypothetical protein
MINHFTNVDNVTLFLLLKLKLVLIYSLLVMDVNQDINYLDLNV